MARQNKAPRKQASGRRGEPGDGGTLLCRSEDALVQDPEAFERFVEQAERDFWELYLAGDRAGRYGFQEPVWDFEQGRPVARAHSATAWWVVGVLAGTTGAGIVSSYLVPSSRSIR